MAALVLPPSARRAFDRMAGDFRRVLGPRFVALLAVGQASSAAFVTEISAADLQAFAALTGQWHREGLATPLVMTPAEFGRSLDAFPLEYQAMIDHHVVIAGTAPFDAAAIAPADLRRACEVQAKSHLIHLRQGWIESGADDEELAGLIERSAEPLRVLLTNLARLDGAPAGDTAALAAFADRRTGMPADLVAAVLSAETAPQQSHALVPRLPEYLAAASRLWAFVDTWRAE